MLKTLTEFNQARKDDYERADRAMLAPRPNGIACPDCGKELVDLAPNATLMSNPPKKRIGCQSCGYSGYRIA